MNLQSLSIQYHALPEENVAFIQKWAEAYSLWLLDITHTPFVVIRTPQQEGASLLIREGIDEVALSIQKPLPASTGDRLADLNPFLLYVRIGHLGADGLSESFFGCRTPKPLPPTWVRIARDLRKATKGGAIARNPRTGKTTHIRNHRFAPKAAELSRSGLPMLAMAGVCVYEPE